jgi:hypothetical protein
VQQEHSADYHKPSRYRIEAMADSTADVVRDPGGLPFKTHAMAAAAYVKTSTDIVVEKFLATQLTVRGE